MMKFRFSLGVVFVAGLSALAMPLNISAQTRTLAKPCHCDGSCPNDLGRAIDLTDYRVKPVSVPEPNILQPQSVLPLSGPAISLQPRSMPRYAPLTSPVLTHNPSILPIDEAGKIFGESSSILTSSAELSTFSDMPVISAPEFSEGMGGDGIRGFPGLRGGLPSTIGRDPTGLVPELKDPYYLSFETFRRKIDGGIYDAPADPTLSPGAVAGGDKTSQEEVQCKRLTLAAVEPGALACAAAVDDLCKTGGICPSGREEGSPYDQAELSEAKLIENYDKTCFNENNDNKGFGFDYIEARSGVLKVNEDKARESGNFYCEQAAGAFKSTDGVFCSAAILTESKIVSARHCFFEESGPRDLNLCLTSGAVEFSSFSDPNTAYPVSKSIDHPDAYPENRTDDYVFLDLDTPNPDIKTPTFRRSADLQFAPAVIMAYHQLMPGAQTADEPKWRSKVRHTNSSCGITRATNKCAVTNCQTINAYSGAPIWSIMEDPNNAGENLTALVSIQVKAGLSDLSGCDFDLSVFNVSGNLSIVPPGIPANGP